MTVRAARSLGRDPRDAGYASRFEASEYRFDVVWGEAEQSLLIQVKYSHSDLSDEECYVSFEPFVEFLTGGREKAIVPYHAANMSDRKWTRLVEERRALFAGASTR
jgi:hypothetical protein